MNELMTQRKLIIRYVSRFEIEKRGHISITIETYQVNRDNSFCLNLSRADFDWDR